MTEFRGRRALITGGASGMGLELALALGAEGCDVAILDLNEEALADAAEAVRVLGVEAHGIRADVTSEASLRAARDAVMQRLGPVDIVINSAGVVHGGRFEDITLAQHQQTMRVNVEGVVNTTHVFYDQLLASSDAYLVNIASASGFIGLPNASTYAASKWAVIGFSESIRLELLQRSHAQLTVVVVCPSYVETGMFEGAKPPRTTRMLTPEFMAQRIVRAMRRKEAQVIEPWLAKLTPALKGVLPTRVFDAMSEYLGASSSMDQWRGRDGEEEEEESPESAPKS